MKLTDDRLISEHTRRDEALSMRPVAEQLQPWIMAELAALTNKIISAKSDDERREIAADMRAMTRLGHRLDQIAQRGVEASRNLEKWSTAHE